MARAFVAVVPPASVLDAVERHVERMRTSSSVDVRWTRRATWHLTLCFLGDDVDLDEARSRFDRIAFTSPPTVTLGGVGAFPRAQRARVMWIGVAQGAEWFDATARIVHAAFGVALEHGAVHPHLTIGRLRTPADVAASCDDHGSIGGAFTPYEVVLFESVRGRGGVEHVPRATCTLS